MAKRVYYISLAEHTISNFDEVPIFKNHYIHWSSIVGISLMLTKGEVPSWIIAHFLVEAIASKLKIAKLTQWLKKKKFPRVH